MESTKNNTNTQTLIKMLDQMKHAYINELRKNVELEQLNKELRQELIKALKGDTK
jgi:cell division septum initiation protein DivIVA